MNVISDRSNTVVGEIDVGSSPADVAYDGPKGELTVANFASNNASFLSDASNRVVATVAVGTGTVAVAYDTTRGIVCVANSVQGTLSIISTTQPANLSGRPSQRLDCQR